MDMCKHNFLNEIYEPLDKKAKYIYHQMLSNKYKASLGWYNMHYIKVKDKFISEFFPIPVISIESIGDIGIGLDSMFFEITISREMALEIDYDSLIRNYEIEVYGVDDYLTDFYNINMVASDIKLKIQDSKEKQIHITVYVDFEIEINELLDIIGQVRF